MKKPTHDYLPASTPYKLGTGSPQENACLSTAPHKPTFVFCNFNKFLKNSPDTVRSWIRILREVPDSMLCLLENPKAGTNYLKRFIHEVRRFPKVGGDVRLPGGCYSHCFCTVFRQQGHPNSKMTGPATTKCPALSLKMETH